jgi:hypothetical protein
MITLDTVEQAPSHAPALALRLNRDYCRRARTQKLLRRFMAETTLACKAGEATFWTISADGRHMEGAINSGRTPELIENASVPSNDSVVGLVATSGISACIGPEDYMNPSIAKITGLQVFAMVVAPVMIDAQICGVVSAVNPVDGGVFKPEDLETLQWKAYLLGLLLADADKEQG